VASYYIYWFFGYTNWWKGKEWLKERIGICRKNDSYMKGIFVRASSTSFLFFINLIFFIDSEELKCPKRDVKAIWLCGCPWTCGFSKWFLFPASLDSLLYWLGQD